MQPMTPERGIPAWMQAEVERYAFVEEALKAAQAAKRDTVARLVQEGASYRQIQKITGLPLGTLFNIVKDNTL